MKPARLLSFPPSTHTHTHSASRLLCGPAQPPPERRLRQSPFCVLKYPLLQALHALAGSKLAFSGLHAWHVVADVLCGGGVRSGVG
jgi:hypothetical protein